MTDDALFAEDAVQQPQPTAGGAAAALEEALAGGELPTQFPAGVALARAVMRAVDHADADRKPAVIAQLVRPAVEVLRPLGLMPADVAPSVGGAVVESQEGARVLAGASTPTLVYSAG